MSPLPDFVERHARLIARGPYVQTGCKMTNFIANGKLASLEQVCDRWFNEPSGGAVRYVPLLDRVMVSFADMESVQSGDPQDHGRGRVAEKDVTVWLLLMRVKPFSLLPRWFPIHLFVDSAPALITGREVFGFPKEIGRMVFPNSHPPNSDLVCDTFGFANVNDPNQFGGWLEIIHAKPLGEAGAGDETLFETTDALFSYLVNGLFEMGNLASIPGFQSLGLLQSLWPSGLMRMVFLKQFPDAADNTKAVYQAILETDANVTHFRSGGLHGSWELDLRSLGSHPLQTELGVAPGFHAVGPALCLDFDFVVEKAELIWQA